MRLLTHRRLLSAVVFIALGCAEGPSAPDLLASNTMVAPAMVGSPVATVLELTNGERRRAGVPELRLSPQLERAAQLQSEQMGLARQMDHVLPSAPYPNPADRLAAVSYEWAAYGENVAAGQRSASELVTAWMNSPGHRANIVNPTYTEFGVGWAVDSSGRPYYAEMFGRPMTQ